MNYSTRTSVNWQDVAKGCIEIMNVFPIYPTIWTICWEKPRHSSHSSPFNYARESHPGTKRFYYLREKTCIIKRKSLWYRKILYDILNAMICWISLRPFAWLCRETWCFLLIVAQEPIINRTFTFLEILTTDMLQKILSYYRIVSLSALREKLLNSETPLAV